MRDENGNPFDFERSYNVATKPYIGLGRDGYECFKYPGVEMVKDEEYTDYIENIMIAHLHSFNTSRQEELAPSQALKRDQLIELLHTSADNTSENGFIKVAPRIEGRLVEACKRPTAVEFLRTFDGRYGGGLESSSQGDKVIEIGLYTLLASLLSAFLLATRIY